ncbi:MAG: exodeoxyribonuclease VII large subunit [Acidobacteria bacterium]|nr:exodeoxyribonuclease VII large subunit [Acidobacteriota bacterium]
MEQIPLKPLEQSRRVYSVSEINALARDLLESAYFDIWVEGEVSNLRSPGSGHLYFTLKDASSQIAGVLFRAQSSQLKFTLEDGLKVLTRGRLSLYEARGTYQMICQWMEPAGIGSLQLAFEQLKHRLEIEGLFDAARKRPLPALPQRIGVVTSPTGAALRDFLHVLGRRFANLQITIHPVRVQGSEAAPEVAAAIRRLNRIGGFDVLVICRGGGSLEDLWPFNEETVARAVAESRIPVISAVGHEVDFTICDFVADFRAATPSAAAELVIASKEELEDRITSLSARLRSAMRIHFGELRERIARLGRSRTLLSARAHVESLSQRLDDSQGRLREGLRGILEERRKRLHHAREAISPKLLSAAVSARRQRLRHGMQLGERGLVHHIKSLRERWRNLSSLLDSLSPLAVLDRGYALCLDPESGSPVTDTHQLPRSRRVEVRLRRGSIGCNIHEVIHAQDDEKGI